ncbi:hypothetical protein RYX36_012560, partial [Vicia faba]
MTRIKSPISPNSKRKKRKKYTRKKNALFLNVKITIFENPSHPEHAPPSMTRIKSPISPNSKRKKRKKYTRKKNALFLNVISNAANLRHLLLLLPFCS